MNSKEASLPYLLRFKNPLVARYLLVGGLNTLFGYAVIAMCMSVFGMTPLAANATGFVVGYAAGFMMHRQFTFRSTVGWSTGMAAYLPVVAIGYAANVAVLLASTRLVGLNPYAAQALAIGVYAAMTFLGSSRFVFGRDR